MESEDMILLSIPRNDHMTPIWSVELEERDDVTYIPTIEQSYHNKILHAQAMPDVSSRRLARLCRQ